MTSGPGPSGRQTSPIAQGLVIAEGQDISLKVMTTKVGSALLEKAAIHLMWKVRLESVLGGGKKR